MNTLYENAKQLLNTGGVNWIEDDIRVALLSTDFDNGYLFYPKHTAMTDVPLTAIVADGRLETMVTGGCAAGKPVLFKDVGPPNNIVSAILIYKDAGSAAKNTLIAYIDKAFGCLPLITNGGDIWIDWDQGPNKIFKFPDKISAFAEKITKNEVIQ